MALPDGFNELEFLQDTIKKTVNVQVLEFFRDQPDLKDLDIKTPRGALKMACYHKDEDPLLATIQRCLLFYLTCGQFSSSFPEIYGLPVTAYDEVRRYAPQVRLYFLEDEDDVEPGYSRVTGEITFRLATETNQSLSNADLERIGLRVKSEFGSGGGFEWRKGKIYCSYTDPEKGYKLQLLCRDKAFGKTLVGKILDIQSHTPNWANFKAIETENSAVAYPTIPPTKTILGKSRRMPRRRPIATVRFRSAAAFIWGLQKPVLLYDRTGYRRDALVSR